MITRTDLLNHLAEKYQLKRYLEIGVQNPIQNFDKIKCEYKVSVDPDPNAHATFCMTSDEFFDMVNSKYQVILRDGPLLPPDLVFIDGMHTAEQVKKDFYNAINIISQNGFIVLHDCNPETYDRTLVPRPTPTGSWNGDVYKFAIHIDAKVTIDIDHGCLVYRYMGHSPTGGYDELAGWKEMEWDYFDKNRKELLNLISWYEFISTGSHV